MNDEIYSVKEELRKFMTDPDSLYEDMGEADRVLSEIVSIERRHIFGSGVASASKRIKDVEDVVRKNCMEE